LSREPSLGKQSFFFGRAPAETQLVQAAIEEATVDVREHLPHVVRFLQAPDSWYENRERGLFCDPTSSHTCLYSHSLVVACFDSSSVEYQELATRLRRKVVVGFWDTEGASTRSTPSWLGKVSGTPTLKLLVPNKKGTSWKVLDYTGERTAEQMEQFAVRHMASFVEKVRDVPSLEKSVEKALKYKLPVAVAVNKKSSSDWTGSLKSLSAEFRRRMLLLEVSAKKELLQRLDLPAEQLPAVLVFPNGELSDTESRIVFPKDKKMTQNRLSFFLS